MYVRCVELQWRGQFRHRFGSLRVSLSNAPVNAWPARIASSIAKTAWDMDSEGRVRFEWERPLPEGVRFLQLQQMDASEGEANGFRGLEIDRFAVYGSDGGVFKKSKENVL